MPYQYSLEVTDQLGVLQLQTAGGDCTFHAEWEQDQWFQEPAAETVFIRPEHIVPDGACVSAQICLKPSVTSTAQDEGFALAEDTYDDTEDYLEAIADNEDVYVWQMRFVLPDSIPEGRTIGGAYLSFRIIQGEYILNQLDFDIDSIASLDTTAPDLPSHSGFGQQYKHFMGRIQFEVTNAVQYVVNAATSPVDEIILRVAVSTSGDTSETFRVATSRHETVPAPRLIIVL